MSEQKGGVTDPTQRHLPEEVITAMEGGERRSRGGLSSLGKRRYRDAEKLTRAVFLDFKSLPALKERELSDEERGTLIADWLADEPIPPSLRDLAREVCEGIAERVAGGNRLAAETFARERSVEFRDALMKTAWSGEDEGFDPRAIVAGIGRNRS